MDSRDDFLMENPAMRIWRFVWMCSLSFLLLVCAWSDEKSQLTIMTYNIHHGEGLDGKIDLPRIAGVIRSVSPDLVALQEVDVKTGRSGGVDQGTVLGKLTGMAMEFTQAIDYDGGQYGVVCLWNASRLQGLGGTITLLPCTPGWEQRVLVERYFLFADSNNPTPAFRFFFTHLDFHQEDTDRMASVKVFLELLGQDREIVLGGKSIPVKQDFPSLFAGDLNDTPTSRVITTLKAWWFMSSGENPAFTIPAEAPDRKIDYILYRPANRWKVIESKVIEEKVASDHRPYVTRLELLPASQ